MRSPEDLAKDVAEVIHGSVVMVRLVGTEENIKRLVLAIEKAIDSPMWPSRPKDDFEMGGAVRVYCKIDTLLLPEERST